MDIDFGCWYRWILILGRMGSGLPSRLIIILQVSTGFHHLPQTQLIRVVRATYPNVEPQPPPAQDRLHPSAHRTSRDARPCTARSLQTQGGETQWGWSASGTTPPWVQPFEVSQLLAECQQHPPRNWVQRQRQTAQAQPQCIHDDRKN